MNDGKPAGAAPAPAEGAGPARSAPTRSAPTRSALYTVMVNVAVFLGLALFLYFMIPTVDLIGKAVRPLWPSVDKRGTLANYAGQPWAAVHFAEMQRQKTDFIAYLGWRRQPFQGQTITVEEGMQIRRTPAANGNAAAPSVYFFGGSTMWGAGADDARTIPALYQQAAGGKILNFGESGWTAHQSLNQLIKLYAEGHRPDVVVFYDGVNDVSHKCRHENDAWAYERQGQIRRALAYRPAEWGYYAQPILGVVTQLAGALRGNQGQRFFDCERNPRKAELLAEQVITDWKVAKLLVESHGGRFHAVLQPVGYFSKTRLDHLRLGRQLGEQFGIVYPIIRRKMAEQRIGADLTDALDRDEFIYIDFCHLSPNGNALVAARIAQTIAAPARP